MILRIDYLSTESPEASGSNISMTNVKYYGDAVHKIHIPQNASGKLTCFQQINRKEIQERDGSGNFQIKSDLQATSINPNVSILFGTK